MNAVAKATEVATEVYEVYIPNYQSTKNKSSTDFTLCRCIVKQSGIKVIHRENLHYAEGLSKKVFAIKKIFESKNRVFKFKLRIANC